MSELDAQYFFPTEPIPRLSINDPLALQLIKSEVRFENATM